MPSKKTELIPKRTPEKKRRTPAPVHQLAAIAVEAILSKKGEDVVIMDMRSVSGVADLFVLCTGTSDLQIKAIVDAVRESVKEQTEERPWHVEGYAGLQWVLLDYVDLVVHVFSPEKRSFYDLERLWGDAPMEKVADDAVEGVKIALLEEIAQAAS
ncbi:MAG: ribosome silencing factor [Rhodothermales bacterium]